ncbi:OadG family transporter subunit [uncultured Cohaesibacter sp.]|uniref:OadG family protein n=1 Tax=uncultured Cohaesibacter sp. TaxID=1002546 RepID=UPI0029C5FF59|nr:OadG family transporter subunit [uncultured Cohaesibacter sp.]
MLDNIELILTGFAVVMMALASLWAACSIVGYFFTRAPKTTKAEQAPKVPARAAVASRAGIPPHHLAAIAAAVADTLGPGYRVTRVAAPAHKVSEWPMEGRIAAFSAHKIRADWGPTRPSLGGETLKS